MSFAMRRLVSKSTTNNAIVSSVRNFCINRTRVYPKPLRAGKSGIALLHDPLWNKGECHLLKGLNPSHSTSSHSFPIHSFACLVISCLVDPLSHILAYLLSPLHSCCHSHTILTHNLINLFICYFRYQF